jgi:choline dehydrogenase
MIDPKRETGELLVDRLARGELDRRQFLALTGTAGLLAALNSSVIESAMAASDVQRENRSSLRNAYDYIVVGAGSAGSVLAGRLAEAGADILVLEAGGDDTVPQVSTPGLWFTNGESDRDWHFKASPSLALLGRSAPVAAGRVLGGGGSINAMSWVRGLASDYDGWRDAGCTGWGFADLLPIFKRIEDWQGGANEWRGAGGPIPVGTSANPHPTARAFVEAARGLRIDILDDMNAPMRAGAGFLNTNITPQGTRASSARCFLRPALARSNLTLQLNAQVAKLTFKGKRCTGVSLVLDGTPRTIGARKEVLLTSGTFGSAKLLMFSGVGPTAELRANGIVPFIDLPGVGQNLQDHALTIGVVFAYHGKMPPILPASNAREVAAFLRSSQGSREPDIEIVTGEYPALTPQLRERYGALPHNAFTIAVACTQPTSRGAVRLADGDWRSLPVIDGPYLKTDHDLQVTLEAIELARQLGSDRGFDAVRDKELAPGGKLKKRALADFARIGATSFGHACGTCSMGTSANAVVDPHLRVHGISGLRVCDSSIIPRIPSGPTNAVSNVIGSKAADLVLG